MTPACCTGLETNLCYFGILAELVLRWNPQEFNGKPGAWSLMDEKQLNQTGTKAAKLVYGIHTHGANVDRKNKMKWLLFSGKPLCWSECICSVALSCLGVEAALLKLTPGWEKQMRNKSDHYKMIFLWWLFVKLLSINLFYPYKTKLFPVQISNER